MDTGSGLCLGSSSINAIEGGKTTPPHIAIAAPVYLVQLGVGEPRGQVSVHL